MKKSRTVVLLTVFTSAVAACVHPRNQWITGEENGMCRDTCLNEMPYRLYRGTWYPVYSDMINPGIYIGGYHGASSSFFYHPATHTGGFGKSGHSSSIGA